MRLTPILPLLCADGEGIFEENTGSPVAIAVRMIADDASDVANEIAHRCNTQPDLLAACQTAHAALVPLIKDEECDHAVGICFCEAHAASLALAQAIARATEGQR